MLDLFINKENCGLADGIPDYYVSDTDFVALLNNRNLQAQLYLYFGKATGIGRLGKEDVHGVYVEDGVQEVDTFDNGTEGVSFYDKIL